MTPISSYDKSVQPRGRVEQRIVKSTVRELLAAGFALSVDDGGETFGPFTVEAPVFDALMNTDEDYLFVHRVEYIGPTKQPFGWVRFVYGNDGWDVINDYTTNLEKHLTATNALIERLSA